MQPKRPVLKSKVPLVLVALTLQEEQVHSQEGENKDRGGSIAVMAVLFTPVPSE